MKKQIFYTKPCLKVLKAETGSLLAASGITGSGEPLEWGAKGSNFCDDTDTEDDAVWGAKSNENIFGNSYKTNRAAVQTYKKLNLRNCPHFYGGTSLHNNTVTD